MLPFGGARSNRRGLVHLLSRAHTVSVCPLPSFAANSAGRFPFGDMELLQSIHARSQGPPADIRSVNRELPRHLADAVMRCLAVDPADRFQSAAELLEALTLCAPENAARVWS